MTSRPPPEIEPLAERLLADGRAELPDGTLLLLDFVAHQRGMVGHWIDADGATVAHHDERHGTFCMAHAAPGADWVELAGALNERGQRPWWLPPTDADPQLADAVQRVVAMEWSVGSLTLLAAEQWFVRSQQIGDSSCWGGAVRELLREALAPDALLTASERLRVAAAERGLRPAALVLDED